MWFSIDSWDSNGYFPTYLFLYLYDLDIILGLQKFRSYDFTIHNIADVFSLNNSKLDLQFTSYVDLHINIDSESRVKTKFKDKRDDFNIPLRTLHLYFGKFLEVLYMKCMYISQLVRYSRACCFDHDIIDRGLLRTRKQLSQWFVVTKLKSSLPTFNGCY